MRRDGLRMHVVPMLEIPIAEQSPAAIEIFEVGIRRRPDAGAPTQPLSGFDIDIVGHEIDGRTPVEAGFCRFLRGVVIARVVHRARQRAEFGNVRADFGRKACVVPHRAGPQIDEAIGHPGGRFREGGQQAIRQIAGKLEQMPVLRGQPAREQSAHHADIRFEHLHVAVDIEMKMALDLAHTFFEFAVEAHHI